jgi:multidrug efflux pump subunit AcrA (membrane-fusion protein)
LVGMTANVKVQVGEARNALLVPSMALQKVNGMYQVLVADSSDPQGQAVSVPVEVGLSDGTYTQITKGLNVGDRVVVEMPATTSQSINRFGGGFGPVIQSGPLNRNNGR